MYAFVTLVMNKPHYVNGTIALAQSLRLTNTQHKIVCMITIDLIQYQQVLQKVFDSLFIVPYLNYRTPDLRTKKQNDIYNEWKDISFTKWNCLNISMFKKICFLDADLIVQKNIDHLFNLPAPAGCFGNNWSSQVDYFGEYKYNDIIHPSRLEQGLTNGYVVNGHCIILEPSKALYTTYLAFMRSGQYNKHPKCLAMTDEVALVKFFRLQNKFWTQIDMSYNSIPWKNTEQAHILHYFNKTKPWQMEQDRWPDLKYWYAVWNSIKSRHPDLEIIS